MKTAILIDGGFFLKRYPKFKPDYLTRPPKQVAKDVFDYALANLNKLNENGFERELYRIFFYDCPPVDKKVRNPISNEEIDYAKTATAIFRNELHAELKKKRKIALRLGRMASYGRWQMQEKKLKQLLRGDIELSNIVADDVTYQMTQKGVDMRLGLDISSLANDGKIDQIVLIAGDSDFVPAAKMARRAGVDFILDPMWSKIGSDLHEHIDGIISAWDRPS